MSLEWRYSHHPGLILLNVVNSFSFSNLCEKYGGFGVESKATRKVPLEGKGGGFRTLSWLVIAKPPSWKPPLQRQKSNRDRRVAGVKASSEVEIAKFGRQDGCSSLLSHQPSSLLEHLASWWGLIRDNLRFVMTLSFGHDIFGAKLFCHDNCFAICFPQDEVS